MGAATHVSAAAPRPRIGLLGSWKSRFPSNDGSYSSLDTVTWSTARALARHGFEVVVGGAETAAATNGIQLVPVRAMPDHLMRRAWRALGVPSELRPRWSHAHHHPFHVMEGVRALRRSGAKLIQLTHEFANLHLARLAAGVPLVTHLHAVWVDDHPRLARRLCAADAVSTVSDYVRRALCEIEPRLASRTFTVRNGVDLAAFPGRAAVQTVASQAVQAWRARLGAGDRPLVVAVGRVAPEKGHHVLAAASARLASRGYDPVVVVAGPTGGAYERPGRARSPLWRQIEALVPNYAARTASAAGTASFVLLGGLVQADLRTLLAAADVFVAPSLSPEPCPLPVLEAMAMDLPVVASATGGYPELVGEAALLVEPGCVDALADALVTLLDSAERRNHLATLARRQAARHTWDATAEQMGALVAQLT